MNKLREPESSKEHIADAIFNAYKHPLENIEEVVTRPPKAFIDYLEFVATIGALAGAMGVRWQKRKPGSPLGGRRKFDVVGGAHDTARVPTVNLETVQPEITEFAGWQNSYHARNSFYQHLLKMPVRGKNWQTQRLRAGAAWNTLLGQVGRAKAYTPKEIRANDLGIAVERIARKSAHSAGREYIAGLREAFAELMRANAEGRLPEANEEFQRYAARTARLAIKRGHEEGLRLRQEKRFKPLLENFKGDPAPA
ncbi:MAG: hypothetical protein V1787_00640 [Candidatus Micrarchaeota archaeon]